MNRARLVVLLIALALALILAIWVGKLATPRAPTAVATAPEPPKRPMTQVLVAKRNLPIGTRLTQDDLAWQPWPLEALNKAFITDGMVPRSDDTPKTIRGAIEATTAKAAKATQDLISPTTSVMAMVGAVVKDTIAAGEPVTAAKVIRAGDSNYMSVVIASGMRAISIAINAESSVSGFILPGDRVDVLQTRPSSLDGKTFETQTLMHNVRVLAIDQKSLADKGATAMVGSVAVLEIPARYVDIIAKAKLQGEMQLVLRSYTDIGGSAGPGGVNGGPLPQPPAHTLTVYRAGQASDVVVR